MAGSNAKKRKKRQQAQKRNAHAAAKTKARESESAHLPKTGTAEDDAYLLRRSREDLVDFGLMKAKPGWVNTALILGVIIALALGVLWLVAITRLPD